MSANSRKEATVENDMSRLYRQLGVTKLAEILLENGVNMPLDKIVEILEQNQGKPKLIGHGSSSMKNAWKRYQNSL
jgi:hypothetical protein